MTRKKSQSKVKKTAHLEALYALAQKVVATGTCPSCHAPLRRNLSLAGWWTCSQRGAATHRVNPAGQPCDFDCFTE